MKPIQFFKNNPHQFTREDLGLPPKESIMSSVIQIVVPTCDTCKRVEEPVGYLGVSDSVRASLVSAGLYEGHPGNVYNNVTGAAMAEAIDPVISKLLSDPLKYMEMLKDGDDYPGRYERLIRELMSFVEKCKSYPTSMTKVDTLGEL